MKNFKPFDILQRLQQFRERLLAERELETMGFDQEHYLSKTQDGDQDSDIMFI